MNLEEELKVQIVSTFVCMRVLNSFLKLYFDAHYPLQALQEKIDINDYEYKKIPKPKESE